MKDQQEPVPFSPPASIKESLQQLIRKVKERELEAGRSLAYEELRVLPLPPPMIERILRHVSEQRSTDGVVACLESFAATLYPTPLCRLKQCLATSRRYLAVLCAQLGLHARH